ncbi:MAG: YaeQ family protein [Rhodocyclaceae bacterium]|nr:YaeQ family protein [Rhodocyclaceae bacterium]
MALKSTIFKVNLGVSDLDRPHYGDYGLTLARHPSETDERMMVRLLAFALHADPRLEFGKGLASTDEPALWLKEYSGEIRLWIEVGLPDERALRKAAGRADKVVVIAYGGRACDLWWAKEGPGLARFPHLTVLTLAPDQSTALVALAQRNMQLQCTIQDGQLWFSNDEQHVPIELNRLKW